MMRKEIENLDAWLRARAGTRTREKAVEWMKNNWRTMKNPPIEQILNISPCRMENAEAVKKHIAENLAPTNLIIEED